MLPDRIRRIAAVALGASAREGFALGGGSALAFHGVTRSGIGTKVIELVTDRRSGAAAAGKVEAALCRAGNRPERLDHTAELRGVLPPGGDMLAQFRVPTVGAHDHPPRGGVSRYTCEKCYQRAYLELGRGPRSRDPVVTEVGPVVHVEDAAGQKVRDLVSRGRVRDFAVTADLLERWSPAELIGFARRLDPGLTGQDLSQVATRLAALPEVAFTGLGVLRPQDVPRLRERFARWSREARDTSRQQPEPSREQPGRHRERTGPDRDTGGRAAPQRERQEPGQPARSARGHVDRRQRHRAEHTRHEPGADIQAMAPSPPSTLPARQEKAGRKRPVVRRGKDRDEPEIGR